MTGGHQDKPSETETTPPRSWRRRRRERLRGPVIVSGSVPVFEPTTANWKAMEDAYDRPLAADDREEIAKLVWSYFLFEKFERSAAWTGDAEKWLANVRAAAEWFDQALSPGEQLKTENEREAGYYALSQIEQCLREWHYLPVRGIHDMMNAFLTAITYVENNLKDSRGNEHVEGRAWGKLIIGLTLWFKRKKREGYKTGARKDSDKSNNPSVFVAFVKQLQLTFPEELRLYMHSDGGLATEIIKVRKGMSPRGGSLKPEAEAKSNTRPRAK